MGCVHAGRQVCFSLWRSIALRYSTGAKSSVSGSALATSGDVAPGEDVGKRIAEAVPGLTLGGDPLELGLVLLRPVIGEDDDVALALEEDEVIEDRADGGDGAVEEHGRRLDVLHRHAARLQTLGDELVELGGEQVERDERTTIGVDHDDVEIAIVLRASHIRPSMDLEVEVRPRRGRRRSRRRSAATAGSSSTAVMCSSGTLLWWYQAVRPPPRPMIAALVELRRVGEAGGHRLGVVDREIQLVLGVDDRLGVAEPFSPEGQHVEPVRALVDVDVVVEGLDTGDDAGLGSRKRTLRDHFSARTGSRPQPRPPPGRLCRSGSRNAFPRRTWRSSRSSQGTSAGFWRRQASASRTWLTNTILPQVAARSIAATCGMTTAGPRRLRGRRQGAARASALASPRVRRTRPPPSK